MINSEEGSRSGSLARDGSGSDEESSSKSMDSSTSTALLVPIVRQLRH